jgi:hypothetical protein
LLGVAGEVADGDADGGGGAEVGDGRLDGGARACGVGGQGAEGDGEVSAGARGEDGGVEGVVVFGALTLCAVVVAAFAVDDGDDALGEGVGVGAVGGGVVVEADAVDGAGFEAVLEDEAQGLAGGVEESWMPLTVRSGATPKLRGFERIGVVDVRPL